MVKVMDSATLRQEISALIKSKGLSQDAVGKAIGRSGSASRRSRQVWLRRGVPVIGTRTAPVGGGRNRNT